MRKMHITIGIPAFNEERNIGKLLQSIRVQKHDSFDLDEIIIVSDGSTDGTISEAKKFTGVRVIDDGMRKGKALRMNEIFKLTKSEVVVVLDADIVLIEDAIEQLVQPFFVNDNVMLISGALSPIEPKNFSGKLAFVAYYLWKNAVKMAKNAEMYHCEGPIRAFRMPFYKQLIFPSITADDVFPYFVCKQMKCNFAYIKNHLGYYKLPATLSDFKKQQKRFLESATVQSASFGKEYVSQFYTVTLWIKLIALMKTFFKFPLATTAYFVVWLPIKISSIKNKSEIKGVWDSVISTK